VLSPHKDAGVTHSMKLARCIGNKHLGYCPQCYCLVSYRYGCDFHGCRGEELLTKLPRNMNEKKEKWFEDKMLNPRSAGAQIVEMTPAVAGEVVDAHKPGAAYQVDSEADFDDHTQEHRQAPAF